MECGSAGERNMRGGGGEVCESENSLRFGIYGLWVG